MILINKDRETNTVILTLTELTTINNPVYLMVLYSEYTKKTYRIILPQNTSASKERYDEFTLNTSIFNNYEEGIYSYYIYQAETETIDETTLGNPVEIGKLKLFSNTTNEEYTSLNEEETEDDFITYEIP